MKIRHGLFILIFSFAINALANDQVVLVSYENSVSDELSTRELKKAFLGIPVVKSDTAVIAIRNYSDNRLHEIFLQKVVRMSSRTYERQINSRAMREGNTRPLEALNNDEVISFLKERKGGLTYMWASEAANKQGLTVLQTLWTARK